MDKKELLYELIMFPFIKVNPISVNFALESITNILKMFFPSMTVLSFTPSIVNVLSMLMLNSSNVPSDMWIVDPSSLLSIPCLIVLNGFFSLPSAIKSSPSAET